MNYHGLKGYISTEFSKLVKPSSSWLGSYSNYLYSGSGTSFDMTVYKKTPTSVFLLSRTMIRTWDTKGDKWKYTYYNYYGKAKLTSKNTASFNSSGCKATFKLKGKEFKVYEKSRPGSCEFTGFGTYYDEVPIYKDYNKY